MHLLALQQPQSLNVLLSMQSVEQLAFADVVVINKTDLVTDEEKTALKQRIKVIMSYTSFCSALMLPTPYGDNRLVVLCMHTHKLCRSCMLVSSAP